MVDHCSYIGFGGRVEFKNWQVLRALSELTSSVRVWFLGWDCWYSGLVIGVSSFLFGWFSQMNRSYWMVGVQEQKGKAVHLGKSSLINWLVLVTCYHGYITIRLFPGMWMFLKFSLWCFFTYSFIPFLIKLFWQDYFHNLCFCTLLHRIKRLTTLCCTTICDKFLWL